MSQSTCRGELRGTMTRPLETAAAGKMEIVARPHRVAYENGSRDYRNISRLDVAVMFFSKNIGHVGGLGASRGGDFTKIGLSWLNGWLKNDQGATGKGALVGAGCRHRTSSACEVKSAKIP